MSKDLCRFYDFTDKVVLYVGAAGRQLLDTAIRTRKLIAIDKNAEDLRQLETKLVESGGQESFEVIAGSFEDVSAHGDAVYLEFCLHEMEDPESALIHAKSLAPDVVVYDHSANSEWIYYGAEETKVKRSSEVMQRFGIRRRETFQAEQRFADQAELLAKVGGQGSLAIQRVERFALVRNIVIPMSYELVLL